MNPINELVKYYERYAGEGNKSLRNFSKFLDIDPSTISKILEGKRKIPRSKALSIAEKIFTDERIKAEFVYSVINNPTKKRNSIKKAFAEEVLDQEARDMFQIISQWEFFAILNILKVKKFDHSVKFIANSLGISVKRTNYCLEILLRNHFITIEDGLYKRKVKKLNTTNEVMSRALQLSHLEELDLAKKKIHLEVERKYYRSSTFSLKLDDIPKFKKIITEMMAQINELTENQNTDNDEVYLLTCQLFPLSNCLQNSNEIKRSLH